MMRTVNRRAMSLRRRVIADELSTIVNNHMTILFTSERNKNSSLGYNMSNVERYRITKGTDIALLRPIERSHSYFNFFSSSAQKDPLVFKGLYGGYLTDTGFSDAVSTTENSAAAEPVAKMLPLLLGAMAVLGPVKIKEIAIPCANDMSEMRAILESLGARPHGKGKIPGLYQLALSGMPEFSDSGDGCEDGGFVVRLAPLPKVYIVLRVDNITTAKEVLTQRKIEYESIGGRVQYDSTNGEGTNGSALKSEEEIHILSSLSSFFDHQEVFSTTTTTTTITTPAAPSSSSCAQGRFPVDFGGISIRLSESDLVKSFFNEESHSITHGTIKEIQSDRIYGGDATVKESKYGYAGDCWTEAHAMARTRVKAFIQNPLSTVTYKTSGPRISDMPSIKE
jgi:hypothetical protein